LADQRIIDYAKRPILVGTRIIFGGFTDQRGVVTKITEYDVDYDDDLGRGRIFEPKVYVRLDDGSEEWSRTINVTNITWGSYPDGPDEYVFEANDLEVDIMPGEAKAVLDNIDEIVRLTSYTAQAQQLRGIALLMRAGQKITPEILEEVANDLDKMAQKDPS
jgi:hypothetical protein